MGLFRRWRRTGLWILGGVLLAALPRAEAREPSFKTLTFRTGGKIDRRVFTDLNRDGLRDLVLLRGRLLLLYLQDRKEGFRRWPDQVLTLARNAVLCDFADLKAAGGPALVLAAEGAVSCLPFRKNKFEKTPRPLFRCRTALGYPGEGDLLCRRLFYDCDGDGLDDILLPGETSYEIFRQDKTGAFTRAWGLAARPSVRIRVPRDGELGQLTLTARFPLPVLGDFDGDGLRDVILRHGRSLSAFLRTPKGFPSTPQSVLSTRSKDEDTKKAGRFSLGIETPVVVEDLNGDGIVDVVKAQPLSGRTLVFLRKKGQTTLADPHLVARVDGWPLGAMTRDLNRDGRPDLVIGHVDKIGVWGALKIFLTRTVALHSAYFINRKGYSASPDRRMTLTVPLQFATTAKGFRLGTSALVNFDGDFNGDGHRDLLVKTGALRLEAFAGTEKTVFARKPFLALEIPDTEDAAWVFPDVEDLNGDGVSDILLHYRDWEEKMDRIVLLLSEGKE